MDTNEYRTLDFELYEIPGSRRLQAELALQRRGHARRYGYGPGDSEQYDDWDDDDDSDDDYDDYEDWNSDDEGYYEQKFNRDYDW